MEIESIQRARHSLVLNVFYRDYHLGPEKRFIIDVLTRLENAILNLVFANSRAILLIF